MTYTRTHIQLDKVIIDCCGVLLKKKNAALTLFDVSVMPNSDISIMTYSTVQAHMNSCINEEINEALRM